MINVLNLQVPVRSDTATSLNTPDRDRFFRNVTNCVNHTTGYENIFEVLGRGSYGTVIKAVYKGCGVAAKVVKNDSTVKQKSLLNESNVLNWNHPNVIKIFKIVCGPECSVIIMERQEGDDLQNILNEQVIPYCHKILILCDIINGLHYCHRNQIVHLDIKPQNILIEFYNKLVCPYKNYNCKLCDFGASQKITATSPHVIPENALPGTARYMAPEILKCEPIKDARCDIYSLGITMWQLKTNQIPYGNYKSNETVIYQVVKHNYRPDDNRVLKATSTDGAAGIKTHLRSCCRNIVFRNFLKGCNVRKMKSNYRQIYTQCWHVNISRRPTTIELWVKLNVLKDSLFE